MSEITLEDLVLSHEKAKQAIEELEAEQKVIKDEILDRLNNMKLTGTKTKNGYFVKRVTSTLYSLVELSTAQELGAVQQKEVVDSGMLRKLDEKGIEIKGKKVIQYVKIEEAK